MSNTKVPVVTICSETTGKTKGTQNVRAKQFCKEEIKSRKFLSAY
jgi:hypothetical protein